MVLVDSYCNKTLPKYRRQTVSLRLQLHGAIYCPDSFVLVLRYCANLKAISYESTTLNRIVADKSHRVIGAAGNFSNLALSILLTFSASFVRHVNVKINKGEPQNTLQVRS